MTSPSFSMVRRPMRAFSFPGLWSLSLFTMRSFLRRGQRLQKMITMRMFCPVLYGVTNALIMWLYSLFICYWNQMTLLVTLTLLPQAVLYYKASSLFPAILGHFQQPKNICTGAAVKYRTHPITVVGMPVVLETRGPWMLLLVRSPHHFTGHGQSVATVICALLCFASLLTESWPSPSNQFVASVLCSAHSQRLTVLSLLSGRHQPVFASGSV
jgi:hypothetical protein